MKRTKIMIAIAVSIVLTGAAVLGLESGQRAATETDATLGTDVMIERDRFTDEISIDGKGRIGTNIDGAPLVTLHAVVRNEPTTHLMLLRYDRERHWSECSYTHWLVDGRQVSIPTARYEPDIWLYNLDPAQLQQLATAKSIEYRLCNDEYTMSAADLALIAEFERVLSAQQLANAQ